VGMRCLVVTVLGWRGMVGLGAGVVVEDKGRGAGWVVGGFRAWGSGVPSAGAGRRAHRSGPRVGRGFVLR